MARTRFEWTLIALSFAGGCWATWTALTRVEASAHRTGIAVEDQGRSTGETPSAGAPADRSAAPRPAESDGPSAAAPPGPITHGEKLQRTALAEWQKLKQRAGKSRWKRELTEGVGSTAEKLWTGVRGALGAGPSRDQVENPAPPTPDPGLPEEPSTAPGLAAPREPGSQNGD